jgi:hypothetical protein
VIAVQKAVEDPHAIAARQESPHEVGADVAGAAGY